MFLSQEQNLVGYQLAPSLHHRHDEEEEIAPAYVL